MNSKELVRATYRFEKTERFPFDVSEGRSWLEFLEYFEKEYDLKSHDEVFEWLDTDFRWLESIYTGPQKGEPDYWGFVSEVTYSADVYNPPLYNATTIADVDAFNLPDPSWWTLPDFQAGVKKWPDKALVYLPGWMPLFCCACYSFGMDNALSNMLLEPKLFDAYLTKHNEFYLEVLSRGLPFAKEVCDIVWLGDDFASQTNMLFDPSLFRKYIKPHLKKQVQMIRDAGMNILFHSCGAIRSILPDMLDIGINGLLVFQTTAAEMDAPSIARDFGGEMVFYGGICSQNLLTFGSPEEVRAEVAANIKAFDKCGGYVVANTHHGLGDIKGSNIVTMCDAARSFHRGGLNG